jgi:hypothetical protein
MSTRKYSVPVFLDGLVSQEKYEHWLTQKARAHVQRDQKKIQNISTMLYKELIHKAVQKSKGRDAYTGEDLDWSLLSKWRNDEAKRLGSSYKKKFALLPSVDHAFGRDGLPVFEICSWRMNDAKNDLSIEEFIDLSKKVLKNINNLI